MMTQKAAAKVFKAPLFQELDSALFKAFKIAAEESNFTAAAERARMTQSGISQHIAKLESQLNIELFHRVNKKVTVTAAGKLLLQFIDQHEERLDELREKLTKESGELSGTVRYAMPHSCMFTPHFPIILEKRKRKFPKVALKIELCPNDDVFTKLLSQEIDFGFVTRESLNPAIMHQPFCREEYVLAGPKPLDISAEALKSVSFIDYPGMSVLFDIWKSDNLPFAKRISHEGLNMLGSINNLNGAITMVERGMGYSIFPRHCIEELLEKNKVWSFGSQKKMHPIYIAHLVRDRLSKRVQAVLDAFWEMHSETSSS